MVLGFAISGLETKKNNNHKFNVGVANLCITIGVK